MMTDSDLVSSILAHSWTPDYTYVIRKIRDELISDGYRVEMEPDEQYIKFRISCVVDDWQDPAITRYVGSRELQLSFTFGFHNTGSYTIHYRNSRRRRVTKTYRHRWEVMGLTAINLTDGQELSIPWHCNAVYTLIPAYKALQNCKELPHVNQIFCNSHNTRFFNIRQTLIDVFKGEFVEVARIEQARETVKDIFGSCPDELARQVSRLKWMSSEVSDMLRSFKILADERKNNGEINKDD